MSITITLNTKMGLQATAAPYQRIGATSRLSSFAAGKVAWEGDHVMLVLTPKDSKGLTKELVSQVSAQLRKIGCRCVLDEALRDHSRCAKPVRVECVNRFDQLDQAGSSCSDKHSG